MHGASGRTTVKMEISVGMHLELATTAVVLSPSHGTRESGAASHTVAEQMRLRVKVVLSHQRLHGANMHCPNVEGWSDFEIATASKLKPRK